MEQEYQPAQPTVSVLESNVPPQPVKKNKSGLKWLLIVILLLAVAGVGGFFLTRNQDGDSEATPTPLVEAIQTEEPTATPEAIDKKEISIEIQNGTGIAGEAGFLQKELEKLGYKDIEVGNAGTQDAVTTTVTFSAKINDSVKDEITNKLKTIYKSVESKSSSTLKGSDILIVTGVKKGASPAATSKPTSSPKASPTASPKAAVSPTPTPTSTP